MAEPSIRTCDNCYEYKRSRNNVQKQNSKEARLVYRKSERIAVLHAPIARRGRQRILWEG